MTQTVLEREPQTDGVSVHPMDEHNRVLVDNVHPGDWRHPTPAGRYNLVVIGGGTAGLVTAGGAAALGARVALVEKHLLGGDCLNYGCVPSKAIIRAARAVHDARDHFEHLGNVSAFDNGLVWLQHAPVLGWLAWEAWRGGEGTQPGPRVARDASLRENFARRRGFLSTTTRDQAASDP